MNGFERRKELKKNNILEASLDLFLKYGIQKVSVAEVAKEAQVSQVTIYNYFGSKDKLIQEVIIYYVDKIWEEYEELLDSDIPFPEKIKQITFEKGDVAGKINEDFFTYFMKEYTNSNSYIEKFYQEKAFPRLIEFFNEGREKGYIDPKISNEAILVFIQMFTEYMQQGGAAQSILPLTEDLTKLFFYGIAGRSRD
ncbi:TetR/AcrR family transcriptional regulator [Virgibacillus sp. YIM 98842]|uniref:TetR/AcrR family transcriptional regulator n=1 Tax=Virgibacillus sp. YIM 98842 TaxID=2663533 RepID=UPI0013DC2237|nr:TetR/AcrR family transcriptional regulator [Virgibacillus sp. YIM 98842]